jgi:hypothetical protein
VRWRWCRLVFCSVLASELGRMRNKKIQALSARKNDALDHNDPIKIFKMFLEETSLHGWKYLVPSNKLFSSSLMLYENKLRCLSTVKIDIVTSIIKILRTFIYKLAILLSLMFVGKTGSLLNYLPWCKCFEKI